MTVEFHVRTGRRVRRSIIDSGLTDLRWHGDEPGDPLPRGTWGMFRAGVSTRVTTVIYEPRRLSVTIQPGASVEDCDLALGIVRRAALSGNGMVECDVVGTLTLQQLDEVFNDGWKHRQLESAARVFIQLARDRGMIAMPGPTRSVWIGPRVLHELGDGDPATIADRLVDVMRRVLWPDPRYESAAQLDVSGPDGQSFTLAILLPDRPCVLPRTDRLALEDADGVFMITRAALVDLPMETTWLDDGNQLVEGVGGSQWTRVCEVARRLELRD